MQQTKSILTSKIFWAALIPMFIDILSLIMESPILPEKYMGVLSIVSGVLVIFFRYTSTTPITKILPVPESPNKE